jgi:hypothetical protein
MGSHVNKGGLFQSDKYPTCPAGKFPMSTHDPMAQDLIWAYAQRRRAVDSELTEDLEACLRMAGFKPTPWLTGVEEVELRMRAQAARTGEGPALSGYDAERLLATLHNGRGTWQRTLREADDKIEAAQSHVAELEEELKTARAQALKEAAVVGFDEVAVPVGDVVRRIKGELNTILALTQVGHVLVTKLGAK